MPAKVTACIYCSEPFDSADGQGDHIIPVQLGEFRNDMRFRGACPRCNNRISPCEQQLLQCAPESLYREMVKPVVPRRRKRGPSRFRGASGAPAPQFTIDLGDHHEVVRLSPDDPDDAIREDQLVIRDNEGREQPFRLFDGMRPDELRRRVKAKGIGDFSAAWLSCDEATYSAYSALVRTAWPAMKVHERPPTEPGVYTHRGRATFTFDDHYFRAIAKIAFHYYLVHSRRGVRGNEPGFEPIRRFIMQGGDERRFFDPSCSPFRVPFGELSTGEAVLPTQWCHVLGAKETKDVAIAHVQLFLGPRSPRKAYCLTLGTLDSNLVFPGFVWAHVYLYDRTQAPSGYAGSVEEACVRRLR